MADFDEEKEQLIAEIADFEEEKEQLIAEIADLTQKKEQAEMAAAIATKKAQAAYAASTINPTSVDKNTPAYPENTATATRQQPSQIYTKTPANTAVKPLSDPVFTQYQTTYETILGLEKNSSWKEVIDTASMALYEAGVTKYSLGLAAFLCAAYIEKQPIFLIGPNAIDIAKAFCVALIGEQQYGTLYCEGNCDHQTISSIGSNGENIVLIHNLLASGWINRLPEILAPKGTQENTTTGEQQGIFFIATHPFAEDIQVEPKSLYGFMLPLFTEFFVDKKASDSYLEFGGYFADDFIPYQKPDKNEQHSVQGLSRLKLNPLVKNQINSLATTMHAIYPETSNEDKFLCTILPLAYASMAFNEISLIQNDISLSKTLKRELRYVLGDSSEQV